MNAPMGRMKKKKGYVRILPRVDAPAYVDAYLHGKRDLLIWQKRPVHMAKEACSYGKRGLFMWQKRPTDACTSVNAPVYKVNFL